ncbi:ATP-binding protein [Methanosarcina sp. Z-7115]|uniref:ATP-binding protein n=1 Tax=Methanosarcina baikalica TaxID=3073890 RepID=A0ABU2D1H2_9EURY|nr:ATP-binding protein [Methanosarcina sp. Z-7115]MDR7665827.1 ATP-binding protein [Methanosarcina sp. Z-7115]
MVILPGSGIGMMEHEVPGYKSPLYGRRTGQINVEPLKFAHVTHFFPQKSAQDLVQIYGCLGGVPAYLNKFDQNLSFIDNVNKNILQRATFLYDEATFLLKEELRTPTNYELILETISKVRNRVSEISDETGISVQNLPKYLRVLINIGFVTKEWAVVLKKTQDIKTGSIYPLADNFMKFWYTYVYPARSILEINRDAAILRIDTTYDQYLGQSLKILRNSTL